MQYSILLDCMTWGAVCLQIRFVDSLESAAMIPSARADRTEGLRSAEGEAQTGEHDLFRSRLDQIIDLEHALVKLARAIDWRFLEEKFGTAYSDKPGHPPLPTRLMAGLAILKHSYDLSDEALCERWVEKSRALGEVTFRCRRAALPLHDWPRYHWPNPLPDRLPSGSGKLYMGGGFSIAGTGHEEQGCPRHPTVHHYLPQMRV